MSAAVVGRGLLAASLVPASAASAPEVKAEASRMAPVYDGFSHRVSVRWEDDVVVLTLPSDRAGREQIVRFPGWPVPGRAVRPAPRGFVGVGFDGSRIFNYAPRNLPRPLLSDDATLGPSRAPGGASLGRRPDLSGLVGVLLDGFPLYGPVERDGATASELDQCGGHVGLTPDHERAIYHYHVSPARPTVCGCLRGLPLPESAERDR